MAEVPGSTLTPSQLALATAFYIRGAPEQLDWVPPAPVLSTRLSFTPESSTPPAFGPDMRISASANVSFVYLSGAPTPDLLLAEMRSRSLSLLKAGLGAGQRQPVVIQREVNYPVHAAVVDIGIGPELRAERRTRHPRDDLALKGQEMTGTPVGSRRSRSTNP